MAYSEILAEQVRKGLAHIRRVEEKKMFGGIAFMVNGKMCVTVGHDRLMVRIDPALHETAIRRSGARPMNMKGREFKGYVFVDREGLKSGREFNSWLKLALDFNKRAKASRTRARK